MPHTLVNGADEPYPANASRNPGRVSRKLVPIGESRYVLVLWFLGRWMGGGGIRQVGEAEPEARAVARRAFGGRIFEEKVSSKEGERMALREAFDD